MLNANDPPTDISLSQTSFPENLEIGSFIAELSATDSEINRGFEVISGRFNWDQANEDAQSKGGHLATFSSEEEWNEALEAISGTENGQHIWIGASDTEKEGDWKWVTGEPWSWSNWRQTGNPEPNGGTRENWGEFEFGNANTWNDMMNIAGRADIGDFHYLLEKSFTFNLVAGEGDTHNEMFSIQGNQLIAKTPVNYETGNQFSIRIEVTDSGGLKLQKEFELTAVDAPDAPTDILLSNSTVDENLKKGTVVGNLSALDEDDGEKHTYRVLTSQLSSEISDLFPEQLLVRDGSTVSRDTALAGKIIGIYFGAKWCPPCQTFTPGLVNFRNANSEEFEVVFASADYSKSDQLVYMNNKLMEFPSTECKTPASESLYSKYGVTGIPSLIIVSPDGSVISTNGRSEVTNNPDGALAEWKKQVADGSFASSSSELFTVSGNQLKTNDTFDFETNSSFTINIEVTDKDDLTYTKALTIGINDKNDAPTGLTLSPASVAEGQPRDTVVGTFSAEDTDVEDSHSYRLVGGANKALFNIKGDKLVTKAVLDYETKSQYEVIVEAKDSGNLAHSETLIVSVEDVNEPPRNQHWVMIQFRKPTLRLACQFSLCYRS